MGGLPRKVIACVFWKSAPRWDYMKEVGLRGGGLDDTIVLLLAPSQMACFTED